MIALSCLCDSGAEGAVDTETGYGGRRRIMEMSLYGWLTVRAKHRGLDIRDGVVADGLSTATG